MRIIFFVLAALAFFIVPSLTDFLVDWWWFAEVGYRDVFVTGLTWRYGLGIAAFVLTLGWLAAHLRIAIQALPAEPVTFTTREGMTVVLPTRDQLKPLVLALAGGVSLLVSVYVGGEWLTVLNWLHQSPFGSPDPILNLDPAYYIFTMPVLELVKNVALAWVMLAAIGAGVLYGLGGQLGLTPFGLTVSPGVRRHLALLGAGLFVVLAFGAWLERPRMLLTASSIIQGVTYADVHAYMPAALALALASLVSAGLAAYHATTTKSWPAIAAIALYLVTLFGGQLYGNLLQRFAVLPNEQVRETPYIIHNIEATRRAFALDRVVERELSGDEELTREDIDRNRATLDNVRLWDHQPLLETFGQIQEIRTYYDFINVDNDRYMIDGQYRQVMLSARELNTASLPNRTWINERLTFTHGYGLTLGPVNQVTPEGLPVLFIRDLPPVATVPSLAVSEPSIYFGELSNEYAIVRTDANEFHYPKGDDNVYSQYEGRGGVLLDSLFKKLVFALHFRAHQIVLSDDITSESRILFDRQIRRRVTKIAPFLTYDDDPYLVTAEGRLFWMQDAYTTTARYPYSSDAAPRVNYIRNAVKIVIDVYHGDVTFFLAEPEDPLVQTLDRIFPSLLRPIGEMPEALRRHVRYPEGIFRLQSSVYSTYHMLNPAVFYNREDQWEVPAIDAGGQTVRMQPYYTIMRLPGEPQEEFIQMLPFTPRRRDNLASWLVARSDGEAYGQLMVFQFPKQKLIFGPRQVVARINQDQVIAPQITLWNQQGSEVIQGTLMVIPIEESLIYVRPMYLRAQGGRIPELTRVIVAYQNQIVMERTLDAALTRLFGDSEGRRPAAEPSAAHALLGLPDPRGAAEAAIEVARDAAPPAASELGTLTRQAQESYQRALEAQRAGDWAKYGEEIRRLGQILEKMRQE
ncbi:MAG: UPF0182 family protein [Vicinamibacterales bacterium]|nr:UPF0182 family protein [Vicinamibacterales bacterium]